MWTCKQDNVMNIKPSSFFFNPDISLIIRRAGRSSSNMPPIQDNQVPGGLEHNSNQKHHAHTVCSDCISNGIWNIMPRSSPPDPFLLSALFHDLSASAETFEEKPLRFGCISLFPSWRCCLSSNEYHDAMCTCTRLPQNTCLTGENGREPSPWGGGGVVRVYAL